MVKAFTEKEKEFIGAKLKEAAKECLGRYGVKKTTVDQLVEMAGISKGAFYNFYPSKEVLFFSVLEDYQDEVIQDLTNSIAGRASVTAGDFAELVYKLYQDVNCSFVMNLVRNGEIELLLRKLPEELILRHHSFDDLLAQKLFAGLKLKDTVDREVVTASLRAVFMCMLHVKEIGEKDFDRALKLLIRGLAQQIMEGASRDE
jgi:AcrR family transcriptional regulator